MLNYLILATEGLITTTIIAGLLCAWIRGKYETFGTRVLLCFGLAGMAAAIVMSYMKNTTSLVHTGTWNVRIFSVSLGALILMVILNICASGKEKGINIPGRITCVMAGIFLFTILFYALPDIYAYPFNFSLGGAGTFASAFFLASPISSAALASASLTALTLSSIIESPPFHIM